jgi:acyl carrier protein
MRRPLDDYKRVTASAQRFLDSLEMTVAGQLLEGGYFTGGRCASTRLPGLKSFENIHTQSQKGLESMDIDAATESKTKIKQFMARFFQNHDLQDDEDIYALGFVNSFFAMQLVAFVEREFEISIDNQDLDMDNFRTVNALANLIKRKTTAL